MKRETGKVEVNGTELAYEACGSGPAIMLLHGFTLDRRMWRRQVDALAERYRVVCYDARGFGRSALPSAEPYRHCDDAAALIERLALGRVIAVGHSIGAHQMLELALERPDLVAGWVGVCLSGLAGIPFPDDVMKLFAEVRGAARERGVEAAKALWAQGGWFAPAREVPSLAAELDLMLAEYSGWHWTHDNPAKNLEPPAAERLSELKLPSLVLTGERDLPYNTLVGEKLTSGLPLAVGLRLPGAGHMASMEAPEAVSRALADFAARVFEKR